MKKLTSRHRRMMHDLVFLGLSGADVSLKYGITESRLSILRNSPLWKQEEEKLREEMTRDAVGRVNSLLHKAVDVLHNGVSGLEVGEMQFKSAREILDRGGIPAQREPLVQVGISIKEEQPISPKILNLLGNVIGEPKDAEGV